MLTQPASKSCARASARAQAANPVPVAASCSTSTSRRTTVQCFAQQPAQQPADRHGRRTLLAGVALGGMLAACDLPALAKGGSTEVGTYLPSAGVEDLVLFTPTKQKTPALRAGTVDSTNPYRFAIPPSFSEGKVSNTQSGNYCQPRCDEPWTEVIFAGDEGRVELIVSPLQKLTPKRNIKITDLGTPEQLLPRIGNYITGTYLDEEEVVSATSVTSGGGLPYYVYEINASYAKVGPHTISTVTVKGDLAFLFVVSATEKQWAKNEKRLRTVLSTFQA